MGDNSGKNSGSFAKGIFKGVLRRGSGMPQSGIEVRQKQDTTPTFSGRSAPKENSQSAGVMQLDRFGFVKYNLKDEDEIFVSNPKIDDVFDDGEPYLIRVSDEPFDDSVHDFVDNGVKVVDTPNFKPACPSDMFVNARRPMSFEDVDYGEIIIKESESNLVKVGEEKDFTGAGMLSSVSVKPELVKTSTGVADTPIAMNSIIEFTEEPESKEILDTPAGLYTEGNKAQDNVSFEESTEEKSSFSGSVSTREMVATEVEVMHVPVLPEQTVPMESISIDETDAGTVVDAPVSIEVEDVVADILRLTVPELNDCFMTVADLPIDKEAEIPEDGLESFDAKFLFVNVSEPKGAMSSSQIIGRKSISTIGSSLNFTF